MGTKLYRDLSPGISIVEVQALARERGARLVKTGSGGWVLLRGGSVFHSTDLARVVQALTKTVPAAKHAKPAKFSKIKPKG